MAERPTTTPTQDTEQVAEPVVPAVEPVAVPAVEPVAANATQRMPEEEENNFPTAPQTPESQNGAGLEVSEAENSSEITSPSESDEIEQGSSLSSSNQASTEETTPESSIPQPTATQSPDESASQVVTTQKFIKLRIDDELVELPLEGDHHPLSTKIQNTENAGVSAQSDINPSETLKSIVEIKKQIKAAKAELETAEKATSKDQRDIAPLKQKLQDYRSQLTEQTKKYLQEINSNREDLPATPGSKPNTIEYKEKGEDGKEKVVVTQTRDPNTKDVWYEVADGPRTIRVPRIKDGKPTEICDILQYDENGKLVDAIIADEPAGSKSQINNQKLQEALRERDQRMEEAKALDGAVGEKEKLTPDPDQQVETEKAVSQDLQRVGNDEQAHIAATTAQRARDQALTASISSTTLEAGEFATSAAANAQKLSQDAANLAQPASSPSTDQTKPIAINPSRQDTPTPQVQTDSQEHSNAVTVPETQPIMVSADAHPTFSSLNTKAQAAVKRDTRHGISSAIKSAGDLELPKDETQRKALAIKLHSHQKISTESLRSLSPSPTPTRGDQQQRQQDGNGML